MTDRGIIRTRILQELVKAGHEGLTDAELATILSANKNHIPTRRRDVELNGFCRKTTSRRETDTGIPAIVHVATPEGVAFAATGKKVPSRPQSADSRPTKYRLQHIRGDAVLAEHIVKPMYDRDIIRIPIPSTSALDGDTLLLQPVA